MRSFVAPNGGVRVRRFHETERLSADVVEPVREEPDPVFVLHGEVGAMGFRDVFRGDVAERLVNIHVDGHGEDPTDGGASGGAGGATVGPA